MNQNLNQIKSKYIGVAIPLQLHKKLRRAAAEDDLSLSSFLRSALIERLERNRTKKKNK